MEIAIEMRGATSKIIDAPTSLGWLKEKFNELNIAINCTINDHIWGPSPFIGGKANDHKTIVWYVKIENPCLDADDIFLYLKKNNEYIITNANKYHN